VKESSLLSVIGVAEMTYHAKNLSAATFETFAATCRSPRSLVVTLPLSFVTRRLEPAARPADAAAGGRSCDTDAGRRRARRLVKAGARSSASTGRSRRARGESSRSSARREREVHALRLPQRTQVPTRTVEWRASRAHRRAGHRRPPARGFGHGVPELPPLPHLDVLGNLTLGAAARARLAKDEASAVRRHCSTGSVCRRRSACARRALRGQKQRVAIARALGWSRGDPLRRTTSALDPETSARCSRSCGTGAGGHDDGGGDARDGVRARVLVRAPSSWTPAASSRTAPPRTCSRRPRAPASATSSAASCALTSSGATMIP